MQLNSWCVYNWESAGDPISHKKFILECCFEGLKHVDPDHMHVYDPRVSPDVMSPSAMATPPVERFVCTKEDPASISASRKYK